MEFDFWNQSHQLQSNPDSQNFNSRACSSAEDDLWDSEYWPSSSSGSRNPFKRHKGEDGDVCGGLGELPGSILAHILSLVSDTRARNCASLVCRDWLHMERASRRAIQLRGSSSQLHMLPPSFHAVRQLDMSNLSPWGASPFQAMQPAVCGELVAQWLSRAFPGVTHLTVYARDSVDLLMVATAWPRLHAARLVRWHQRPPDEQPGAELQALISRCPELRALDLSAFYCWAEDVPPALESGSLGANLSTLNLLKLSPEGFKAGELQCIAASCERLEELLVICEFDPRFADCIGDECLVGCATRLGKQLRVLHLVDSSQFAGLIRGGEELEPGLDASLTVPGLQSALQALGKLEDLTLLLGHNLRNSAPVFEALSRSCKNLTSLQIGHFQNVCTGPMINGLGTLRSLSSLFIRNCDDLEDSPLCLIAMGCSKLRRLGLRSCGMISETGLRDSTSILRRCLLDLQIESCSRLSTASVFRAIQPLRATLCHLQLDCIWDEQEIASTSGSSWIEWERLESVSLWIPAAQVVSPVIDLGLHSCPALRRLSIRVEGDCRLFPKPRARAFGLSGFSRFPKLKELKLDLSEAVGYALSAPGGNRDLSIWERFYLQGAQELCRLEGVEYYPPSDKDVNYRGVTLPGVGLLSQCRALRRLFVHGSTYEHLLMMLLQIASLRDCQLRADYFPTPEMETGTEMRPESCRRFEMLLEKRGFPD